MVFHMKTTLNIADSVMRRLKQEAARQGRTMSDLVEAALRTMFEGSNQDVDLPPLPTFHGGSERVDISDREALYDLMGRR
jgi:plasmid stability protein